MTVSLTTSTYSNIMLLPLRPGSSQSNIRISSPSVFGEPFNHLRFRNEQIVNTANYQVPENDVEGEAFAGTALYGGVLFPAFGHFIAESLHRLWASYQDPALGNVPIVFHSTGPGLHKDRTLPSWMTQIFALSGIDAKRRVIVNRPITFETLIVPSQGSLLGKGPVTPDYGTIFPPQRPEPMVEREGHLYISRSRFIHGGSYLGEMLVEDVLRETGKFRIIHPQDYPVTEVVAMLESCQSAIFAEGSAIHIIELCRAPVPKIFAIVRRKKNAWCSFYQQMVTKRSGAHAEQEVRACLTSLGWSHKVGASMGGVHASAVQDIPQLLKAISAFIGLPMREPWDLEVRNAQALSLVSMIMDPRATPGHPDSEGPMGLLTVLQQQVLDLDILPFAIPKPPRKIAIAEDAASDDDDDTDRRDDGDDGAGAAELVPKLRKPAPADACGARRLRRLRKEK